MQLPVTPPTPLPHPQTLTVDESHSQQILCRENNSLTKVSSSSSSSYRYEDDAKYRYISSASTFPFTTVTMLPPEAAPNRNKPLTLLN